MEERPSLVIDFSTLIAERTKDFTGREWVFQAINDWLMGSEKARIFLLTGDPGTGKSAIAARLVQMSRGEVESDEYARLGPDTLTFYHFCWANSDATLNPLRFVEALSRSLANRYDPFREALLKTGDRDVTVNATQSVTTAADGSQVQNVVINELRIGALSARSAFDRVVRGPLESLVASGFDQSVVVLVDSLDEALTFPGEENLVTLLRSTGDLPRQVRFILTSRPDKRVTTALGAPTLDLIDDATIDVDDVRTYVEVRLAAQADPSRMDFAQRVAEASQGNFLYARYKLDETIPRLDKGEAPPAIGLPPGLDGIYREFLQRELAANLDAWEERYRPVLGLLTVAQGDGLTGDQIARITDQKRSQADDILRRCEQFLAGPDDRQRVHIYHQSFRDFLQQDADFQIYPADANASIADWYWASCFDQATGRQNWSACDEYGLANLPVHVDGAGQGERLRTLLWDYGWLQTKVDQLGPNALLADFNLAQAAADDAMSGLSRALAQGGYVLARDPAQLAAQLLGRLLDDEDERMHVLLAQARTQVRRPCLLPQTASLREAGALLRTLTGHTREVAGVAVTPDGTRAVSASCDGTLKVWDMASGVELHTLAGHTSGVTGVAVTPDGKRAVSASADNTLKVWDIATGVELRSLKGHTREVTGVALTPDGKRAVSASYDTTLKVWDLATGHELHTLTGHQHTVYGVALMPDGRRAVSASNDGTLKVWDLASGVEVRTLAGHTSGITGVAVTPDGSRVISASTDNTLKVWDLANGTEMRALTGHTREVTGVAVTPDGRRAISASTDNTLKVWDLASGTEVCTLTGHTSGVTGVAVTPDGRRAVSASYDDTLMVWDLATGAEARNLAGHTSGVTGVAVTPDGDGVVSTSWDGSLRVWELTTGQRLRTLTGHANAVTGVAVTPDGSRAISASADTTLKVWDLATGEELSTLAGHRNWVSSVAVTADGSRAVSASYDNTLKVWDLASGEELKTLTGHTNAVNGVAVTPDGRCAISASWDGTLKVWDLARGVDLQTLTGHKDRVEGVAVTPDGSRAVSASWNSTLKVWDLASGAELHTLAGHTGRAQAVAVTPDGSRAVSASADATLKIWDLASGVCLATFLGDGSLEACAVAPDGRTVVAAGASGRVHFLRLETGADG
jgi:WD40 repeat protein